MSSKQCQVIKIIGAIWSLQGHIIHRPLPVHLFPWLWLIIFAMQSMLGPIIQIYQMTSNSYLTFSLISQYLIKYLLLVLKGKRQTGQTYGGLLDGPNGCGIFLKIWSVSESFSESFSKTFSETFSVSFWTSFDILFFELFGRLPNSSFLASSLGTSVKNLFILKRINVFISWTLYFFLNNLFIYWI